jgi:hypothetical protein
VFVTETNKKICFKNSDIQVPETFSGQSNNTHIFLNDIYFKAEFQQRVIIIWTNDEVGDHALFYKLIRS